MIPYPLFVFEAIIRAIPNKVFGFGHTPNYYIACNIDKVIESNSYTQYCNPKIHVVLANSVHTLWLMHAQVVNCFRQRRLVVEVVDHSTTGLVNASPNTHTHTRLFLWIVGTFHRLLLLLYWPNDIFYPLTPNPNPKPTPYRKPVCIVTLSDKHHVLFFFFMFSLVGTADRTPQCQKKIVSKSNQMSPQCSINKYTHTHTPHTHTTHTHTIWHLNNRLYFILVFSFC